jgi:hypothetical protein
MAEKKKFLWRYDNGKWVHLFEGEERVLCHRLCETCSRDLYFTYEKDASDLGWYCNSLCYGARNRAPDETWGPL